MLISPNEIIPALIGTSGVLWFACAAVLLALSGVYKDELLLYFSGAFLLIAASRFISVACEPTDPLYMIYVLFQAGASYLLISGSMNGDARYRATRFWFIASLIVSSTVSLLTGHYGPDLRFAMGPSAFAMAAGFVFATLKFSFWRKADYNDCTSYRAITWIFAAKVVIVGLGAFPALSFLLPYLVVADVIVSLGILTSSVALAFERHRIREGCSKIV